MFTKEEIALAKPTVEAIKKISKKGTNPTTGSPLTLPEWEWEPEVGEWFIDKNVIGLVSAIDEDVIHYWREEPLGTIDGATISGFNWIKIGKVIPLLHWERIEEILEGMGYRIYIEEFYMNRSLKARKSAGCKIYKYGEHLQGGILLVKTEDKTRQEAVMRAVIELGKEEK